jgi:formiminotetrahydrofolate cyclodeaminase
MSLWELTLAEFLRDTASSKPTPGGGAVAAVCATLGTGLIAMAIEITLPKAAPEDVTQLQSILSAANKLLKSLSEHADRDVTVFDCYMQAMALPRATPEEKTSRKAAMEIAALKATEAPLSCAADLIAALEIGVKAASLAKPQVMSDVIAGADLLYGALNAVLRNVDINLPSIPTESLRQQFASRRIETAHIGENSYQTVLSTAASRS